MSVGSRQGALTHIKQFNLPAYDHCQRELGAPAVSGNGRYIAFASFLNGLTSDDTPSYSDVFLKDMHTGKVRLVSKAMDGLAPLPTVGQLDNLATAPGQLQCHFNGNLVSSNPSVSDNGRYVTFRSRASNLVRGDLNNADDIFVRDMLTGVTSQVTVTPAGTGSIGESGTGGFSGAGGRISSDGRFVVFSSAAPDLVIGDANSATDVFVRDLQRHQTTRVSVGAKGAQAPDGASPLFASTPDARVVAFATRSDFAPGVTDADVSNDGHVLSQYPESLYIRDLRKGTTTLGPRTRADAKQAARIPSAYALSSNGRFLVFITGESDSIPNDSNTYGSGGANDVFVLDRSTGRTERVSVTQAGEQVPDESGSFGGGGISRDGRWVVFASFSATLARPFETSSSVLQSCPPDDSTCGKDLDVFVHDRATGATHKVSSPRQGRDMTCKKQPVAGGGEGWCYAAYPGLSANARDIAFVSPANNLVAGDSNEAFDVFVHDFGLALGSGSGGRATGKGSDGDPEPQLCLLPDVCLPPLGVVRGDDAHERRVIDVEGGDLRGAGLVYRPRSEDLFLRLELERMPDLATLPGTATLSPLLYGARFRGSGMTYELRAAGLAGGAVGLFACAPLCSKVADVRGGFGTTGERVTFALPLDVIGPEVLRSDVEVFSALGTFASGPHRLLDSITLQAAGRRK